MAESWIAEHSLKTLKRLLPDIEQEFATPIKNREAHWKGFTKRLYSEWERLFENLHRLYGWQYDFFYTLEQVLRVVTRAWAERPDRLIELDCEREADPEWFLSREMVGGVLYVDLFSDKLARLPDHIPYFRQLGLTYLHLMPLFAIPHGDNDGGYAVSDYRAVNPDIGGMEDLNRLARILRKEGISLVIDFVFNHTSNDHIWAKKAAAGDPEFQNYYYMFPDRTIPDQYQANLRDIFPTVRKGSFTWVDEIQRWVWTTFNSFQWDLNYSNPEVFTAMAEEMFFLANQGIEILRLDAVAFIWKRIGSSCENLDEAHIIIQAYNAMAKIAAPALLFKSEAIVHPDEVIRYIGVDECRLSYNPLLMALLWESLATGETRLLNHAMHRRNRIPEKCSWVNYLRCHDDIGWTFDDADAAAIGIDPAGHRKFLNDFYTGRFPGSFARGVPFQYNPDTGDLRVCGTLASLAGLEAALEREDPDLIETAVRRIDLLRSIMLSIGGIPLIYLGDEWGMMNDYTYLSDPMKVNDSRWVHRRKNYRKSRDDPFSRDSLEWRFFHEMVRLINIRKSMTQFQNTGTEIIETGNGRLFGYLRENSVGRILVVNNFSNVHQRVDQNELSALGFKGRFMELVENRPINVESGLLIGPYRFVWILFEYGSVD